MALIKSIEEFKKFIRTGGSINLEGIIASIPDAQDKYLRDILGSELLTDLDEWHNLDEGIQPTVAAYETILPYAQRALARFTLFLASPELDVILTDSGIGVVSTDNLTPASSDRVKKYDQSNEKRGWDNIETLLRFLEANQDDYPEWVSSDAYTKAIRNLVNSAEEFDSIVNIDKSRLYFSRIRNLIDDADLLHIKPTISSELFDSILDQIKGSNVSEENQKILPFLRRAEVFYTAIESLDREKYDGTGVQINLQFMQRDIDNYTRKAEQYLSEARKILDNNPDDYPEYRDSDVYVGLTDDGDTNYRTFDNTADDNHIFVMG